MRQQNILLSSNKVKPNCDNGLIISNRFSNEDLLGINYFVMISIAVLMSSFRAKTLKF